MSFLTKEQFASLLAMMRVLETAGEKGGVFWAQGHDLPTYAQVKKHVEVVRSFLEKCGR